MKHRSVLLALALAAAALGWGGVAEAQYYDGPRWDDGPRERYDGPPRDWDRRGPPPPRGGWGAPPPPPPGWGRPPAPPPPPGWGRPRQRGGVCVTSRGACPSGPLRAGSPCRCDIPGFGVKRGVVQ